MNATRLLLVRHGESTWNVAGRWQGQADPPLSDLGERQAAAAAAALAPPPDAVWSSDLARARRTAELLVAPHALAPVRLEARLRERDVGEWSGLTRAEIEDRWPGWLSQRRAPAGFETDERLADRALAAIRDIAGAMPGATVIVVTHGGVIRTLERHHGADPEPVPNLGGRWLTTTDHARFALGERRLLIDPDDIEVTVPPPR
ncbi:MAG TPA: histidine phosphatase family protein [Acidimicrobiia bacterium]